MTRREAASAHVSTDARLPGTPSESSTELAHILARHQGREGALLPILHDVQEALGCIPPELVPEIAAALQLSRAEVQGVITFYPFFRSVPAGRHHIEVCQAEACQAMGAAALAEHVQQSLGCAFHATRADGAVTVAPVYCLGLCAQSPAIMIDGQPHARVTPERFDRLASTLEAVCVSR